MSQSWNPIGPPLVPLNSPKAEGHYRLPGLGTMDRGGALEPIRQSHEQIFSFFVSCCLMLRSGRLLLEKGAPLSCTGWWLWREGPPVGLIPSWPVLRLSPSLHVGLQGMTERTLCARAIASGPRFTTGHFASISHFWRSVTGLHLWPFAASLSHMTVIYDGLAKPQHSLSVSGPTGP